MQKRSCGILRSAAAATTVLSASMSMAAIYYVPVVTQVGDGGTTVLSSAGALTTIDVYANGTANQTAPVASASYAQSTSGLQTSGSSGTEGQLANNPGVADAAATDQPYTSNAYVFSGGYAAAANNANVINATTANARVVGYMTVTSNSASGATIGATGTAATTYSGGNIRGAVGNDSVTTFYGAGNATSYRYIPAGTAATASFSVSNVPSNVRQVEIRNGQLYGSSDTTSGGNFTGIQMLGSGMPTPSANATSNNASIVLATSANSSTASPESFVMIDNPGAATPASDGGVSGFAAVPYNVIYVADPETGTLANLIGPGIQKWVYTTGTNATNGGWSLAYTITDTSVAGIGMYAVAGQEDGNGNVILYGTADAVAATGSTSSVNANNLEEFIDPISGGTAAGTDATMTVLATAAANEAFRGVALAPAPAPEPATLSLLGMGAMGLMARRRK